METNSLTKQSTLIEGQGAIMGEEIIIFLLDFSGSMSDTLDSRKGDMERISKVKALREAMHKFISQRMTAIAGGANDSIGVIIFGGHQAGYSAKLIHHPTNNNYSSLIGKISMLRSGGSTPMAEAVDIAMSTVENLLTGFIRLVILSDGMPDHRETSLDKIHHAYDSLGIIIDTIGIGAEGDYSLDEEFMKEAARLGGGEYTRITSLLDLEKKFLEIEQERAVLLGKGIFMLPAASSDLTDDKE